MMTESEIRVAGMQALINALGLVDAERFVANVSRDRLNYTEWRGHGLPPMTLESLAEAANQLAPVLDSAKNSITMKTHSLY